MGLREGGKRKKVKGERRGGKAVPGKERKEERENEEEENMAG